MFENELAINELQLGLFAAIAADISEETFFTPGAGHQHPPVWILGHLAITGEMGCQLLGGSVTHRDWMEKFGPGSSDELPSDPELTKEKLIQAVNDAYASLRRYAKDADPQRTQQPHGISLFDDSPVTTISHAVALLLTNHFGFHLSQLSSCRREQGHSALF